MPVNRVAEILKVNPQRNWAIFNHWISKAKVADDPATITKLGVDLGAARVIHVTEGKGKATLQSIQQHLENKGVDKEQIEQISKATNSPF